MRLPMINRLRYVPTAIVNEYDDCIEIPDAPSILDTLPTFGFKRPLDPIRYDVPDIIKMPLFLLPHQQTAIRKLFHGGILSDAPRMGKTVTALGWTHVQHDYHPNWDTCVVICPAILISQWKEHITRFGCPDVKYQVVSMDAETFPNFADMLIVDEARHIKHESVERYQKIWYMYKNATLLLEATPISDRGTDIYSLLHLVRPEWFPSLEQFKEWYVLKISRFEPLMERLRHDTENIWLWRSKRVNRKTIDHKFSSEKEAYEFVKTLPRPLLIFTDTRKRAESLGKKLGAELLTGDYKMKERSINVKKFQHGEIDCLVCTFWAAGEGLDLSSAKTVVCFGYDWTPATIQQAIARTDHIDPKREKATCYTCLWPGEVSRKKSIATLKEMFLPNDWAIDVTDQLEWH